MKSLIPVAALALTLPLAACLVMPYEPPTDGPLANIRIVNNSPRYLAISFYDDPETCRERHNLLPVVHAGQTRNLTMRAGGPATLTLSQDASVTVGCIWHFTFDPAVGHRYEIVQTATCDATIMDVTEQTPRPVTFQKRAFKRAFDEHGPFCDAR